MKKDSIPKKEEEVEIAKTNTPCGEDDQHLNDEATDDDVRSQTCTKNAAQTEQHHTQSAATDQPDLIATIDTDQEQLDALLDRPSTKENQDGAGNNCQKAPTDKAAGDEVIALEGKDGSALESNNDDMSTASETLHEDVLIQKEAHNLSFPPEEDVAMRSHDLEEPEISPSGNQRHLSDAVLGIDFSSSSREDEKVATLEESVKRLELLERNSSTRLMDMIDEGTWPFRQHLYASHEEQK